MQSLAASHPIISLTIKGKLNPAFEIESAYNYFLGMIFKWIKFLKKKEKKKEKKIR